MRLIDLEYTARPFLGYRKMVLHLREQGHPVNKKRVARLMQIMGLAAMVPGPNTSRPAPQNPVYPYLLRGVAIERINQVWSCDITYIVRHEVACKIVMRSIPDMTGCPITRTLRGNAARQRAV